MDYQHAHITESIRAIYAKAQEHCTGKADITLVDVNKYLTTAAIKAASEAASSSTSEIELLKKQLQQAYYQVDSARREQTLSFRLDMTTNSSISD